MAIPNPAARNQYLKTQVETASKEQLVVMLFDGIIRFTEQARKAIENKEIEASHNALMRAQAIVMELIVTVDKDKGGDIATNLIGLHAYSFNCLVQCNLHKDVSKIDEVQNIYRNLREGWLGAMESLGIAPNAGKAVSASAAAPAAPAAPKAVTPPTTAPKGPAPTSPVGGRPLPAAPAPKAPAAPQKAPGAGTGGVLAAKPAPAAAPAPKAPAAPARPAMPATGYGMGRTAGMMTAYGKTAGAPAPKTPAPVAPVPTPAAKAPAAQAPATTRPVTPNQAAMLGAYQAGRSIA